MRSSSGPASPLPAIRHRFAWHRRARPVFAVCDLTETATRAAVVRFGEGLPEVLGFGQAPTEGLREGRFRNLSDAAESVRTAAEEALRGAGVRCRRWSATLDDGALESVRVEGTARLEKGREGFGPPEVEAAYARALQAARPTDRHLVYQGVARVLVDGESAGPDPVGLFGRELTLAVHLLYSDSLQTQNLQSVFARADFELGDLAPSAWAALRGTAAEDAPAVLLAANTRVCHVAGVSAGGLAALRSIAVRGGYDDEVLDAIRSAAAEVGAGAGRALLAGEAAEEPGLAAQIGRRIGTVPAPARARFSDPAFQSPRFAALAGLAALAREARAAGRRRRNEPPVLRKLRWHAKSFVQEYF